MKDDQKNRVTVEIHGKKYTLMGNMSQGYMEEVAGYVDDRMQELADKNPSLNLSKMAVLTAVNLADEYFSLQKDYEELLKLLEEKTSDRHG